MAKWIIAIVVALVLSGCASWSAQDRLLLGASIAASYADYRTTTRILDEGGYEMNPLIGKYPTEAQLATWMISSEVLVVLLAHYFPKYRTALLGGKTAINVGCAIHNSGE